MLCLQGAQCLGGDHIRHGAACIGGGEKHLLVGIENFSGLRHKANTAKYDEILGSLRRLAGKLQRVADGIGNLPDLKGSVVMRQNQRVLLFFELFDSFDHRKLLFSKRCPKEPCAWLPCRSIRTFR